MINNVIVGASQAVLGQLPSNYIITKSIQRARNEVNQAPPDPQVRTDLIIPQAYQMYDNQKFLLADTGIEDPNRILVFGRQSHGEWSNQVEKLYMDGMFKVGFRKLFLNSNFV